jgi:hypothetical protein
MKRFQGFKAHICENPLHVPGLGPLLHAALASAAEKAAARVTLGRSLAGFYFFDAPSLLG